MRLNLVYDHVIITGYLEDGYFCSRLGNEEHESRGESTKKPMGKNIGQSYSKEKSSHYQIRLIMFDFFYTYWTFILFSQYLLKSLNKFQIKF